MLTLGCISDSPRPTDNFIDLSLVFVDLWELQYTIMVDD